MMIENNVHTPTHLRIKMKRCKFKIFWMHSDFCLCGTRRNTREYWAGKL